MKKPIKRVAVIHDLCGVGKAALTNIIPVLSVMGVEVCPIPTMILSTHTGGFGIPEIQKTNGFIEGCREHYFKIEIDFEAVFVGYLGSQEAIKESIDFLKSTENALKIVDPIFGDLGKCYSNFDINYVNKIKEIIQFSDIITPNYTESCILTNEEYNEKISKDKVTNICRKLKDLGAKNIVITSVPLGNDKLGIAVCENEYINILEMEKAKVNYPGTGDVFTSVLIGMLLKNNSLEHSVINAHNFVLRCICESEKYNYPTKEGVLLEGQLKTLIN